MIVNSWGGDRDQRVHALLKMVISIIWRTFIFLFIYFLKIFYFQREGKGGRNINMWLPIVCPLLGTGPQPRPMP